MANFKFSQLFIHPKGYKDKQGKEVTKWFIIYKIEYEEPPTYLKNQELVQYVKEYGKSYSRDAIGTKALRNKDEDK
jgi:hypothetical protein